MKVVLAPMNIAGMPIEVVKALRASGHEATQLSYTTGHGHKFGYEMDREVNIHDFPSLKECQFATLKTLLDEGYDIFHFWNRSLVYSSDYSQLSGLDLPLIKAHGKKIAHRFTGFDLRLSRWDMKANRFSPFHYGAVPFAYEETQARYLEFLQGYVDQFFVQDPELGQFAPPGTKIIPRALDLDHWKFVGVEPSEEPLVVHAPSIDAYKGTAQILQAVEELQAEGLKFRFEKISGMSHEQAQERYRAADIVVDQILIGATGVLTLEALAMGKPCVVYLREDLFKPFYGGQDLPVVNANPETIKDQLRAVIKDYEWRKDLSVRGRKLVEDYHDIKNVVGKYIDAYQEILDKPFQPAKGVGDANYFAHQFEINTISADTAQASANLLAAMRQEGTKAGSLNAVVANMPVEQRLHLIQKMVPGVAGRVLSSALGGMYRSRQWVRRRIRGARN